MQWYLTDKRRLRAETRLMDENGVNFELYSADDGNLLWRGPLCVSGRYHSDVRLVYDELHPYKQMTVYILDPTLPKTNLHVHEDGSICYIKDEWSPDWTALAVYLTTIRFLGDYYSGAMEDHLPYYLPLRSEPEKSLIERLLEGLRI